MTETPRPQALLLLGLFLLAAGAGVFATVAHAVAAGDTEGFDARVLRALRRPDDPARPRGPAWLPEAARDVTALGSVAVQVVLVAGTAGALLLAGRRRAALLVVAAIGGGFLLDLALKAAFARPRPDVVPPLVSVASASFPSGHSLTSAVTYLTLGTVADHLARRRRVRRWLFALAAAVIVAVGSSRVYLGVHHPTDVLAGWAAGLAWAGAWGAALGWRGFGGGSAA